MYPEPTEWTDTRAMRKRSSKKEDVNQIATRVVQEATEAHAPPASSVSRFPKRKNPAAVSLGRLGGKKGGPARATSLTAEERSAIAKKAAESRWGKMADEKGGSQK